MTYSNSKLKILAKKLLQVSRDEKGNLSSQQVSKVLALIKKQFPSRQLRLLLKHYLNAVKQALLQEQAIIEYAGTIVPSEIDSIVKTISQHYNRSITTIEKNVPELIAGIKIRIVDDVYNTSIEQKLQIIQRKNFS